MNKGETYYRIAAAGSEAFDRATFGNDLKPVLVKERYLQMGI
jgi:hypothetical protein